MLKTIKIAFYTLIFSGACACFNFVLADETTEPKTVPKTEPKYEFDVAARVKSGFVTYQIGGFVSDGRVIGIIHFPLSELRFPLAAKTVQFKFALPTKDAWKLQVGIETNVTSDNGTVEDSDWLTPGSLDVYSVSRSELTVLEGNLRLEKQTGEHQDPLKLFTWTLNYGVGLLAQNYSYRVYDFVQSYPSNPSKATITLNGLALTYRYRQITPQLLFAVAPKISPTIDVGLEFMATPFVRTSDHDEHLLRGKTIDGVGKGWSVATALSAAWHTSPTLSVTGRLDFQKTLATGTQTQQDVVDDVIETAQIRLKHISEQTNVSLGLKYLF